jgi:murein DD-endopeptidase MepM/ murein hydrolase activator NlpD
MTFPVSRSPWLSVIGVQDDWRDPRFRLVGGRWKLVGHHQGNDIMAEEGTPVLALIGGRVERVGWTFYSGTRVGIRGTDGRYYFYAHLSEVGPGITEGSLVETGGWIGRVGSTGYGPPGERDRFPPHLHLGIQEGGAWVNPYPLVRRLYEASARATARGERRLARLARAGDEEGWERVVATLYADGEEYAGSAGG